MHWTSIPQLVCTSICIDLQYGYPFCLSYIQLESHLAIKGGQCPQSEVNCPFKPYGCTFVVRPHCFTYVCCYFLTWMFLYIVHKEEHPNTSRAVLGIPLPVTGWVFCRIKTTGWEEYCCHTAPVGESRKLGNTGECSWATSRRTRTEGRATGRSKGNAFGPVRWKDWRSWRSNSQSHQYGCAITKASRRDKNQW